VTQYITPSGHSYPSCTDIHHQITASVMHHTSTSGHSQPSCTLLDLQFTASAMHYTTTSGDFQFTASVMHYTTTSGHSQPSCTLLDHQITASALHYTALLYLTGAVSSVQQRAPLGLPWHTYLLIQVYIYIYRMGLRWSRSQLHHWHGGWVVHARVPQITAKIICHHF